MLSLEVKTKLYKKYRDYMQIKYGSAYMGAISKLNATDPYDERGILKPEYALTSAEHTALLYYVPEITQPLERTEKIKGNQNNAEEKYQIFLDDVRKKTIEVASNSLPTEENIVVPWEVVGVEFLSWEIEEKYGEDVYKRACEEVPYEKVPKGNGEFYRMFNRDFSKANIRLGHIIHEGISASPLMDLDLLIKLLKEKGIPSYIDFGTNTFYYNGVTKKRKAK